MLQEYLDYLQQCSKLDKKGCLLTPYINIMWCTRCTHYMAVQRDGHFEQISEAPFHGKGLPWDLMYEAHLTAQARFSPTSRHGS